MPRPRRTVPARYDGLADDYDAFVDQGSRFFRTAEHALRRSKGDPSCAGCSPRRPARARRRLGATLASASSSQVRTLTLTARDIPKNLVELV